MQGLKRLPFLCVFILFMVQVDVSAQVQFPKAGAGWQRLNSSLDAAKGADKESITKLVHVAYEVEGLPTMALDALAPITDRLVKAEIDYRTGKKKGIDENNVVRTVNAVARKLGAPEYAYTSPWEVRKLRARLLVINPGLISRDSLPDNSARSGPISEKLSPIEAFHVAAMMVRQKILNPEYQLTHAEQVENWPLLNTPNPASRLNSGNRRREMLETVSRHVALGVGHLTSEGGEMLTRLGIE